MLINGEVIKVIITDDHKLYRAGVKASLSFKKNIRFIGEAENALNLFHLLEHMLPDVILLDIQMPVLDGIAALPKLKKSFPHIKIIMLSMMDDQSIITKCMELGANSYLSKTSDPEIIYQAIRACHNKEYFHNELTERSLYNSSKKMHVL